MEISTNGKTIEESGLRVIYNIVARDMPPEDKVRIVGMVASDILKDKIIDDRKQIKMEF